MRPFRQSSTECASLSRYNKARGLEEGFLQLSHLPLQFTHGYSRIPLFANHPHQAIQLPLLLSLLPCHEPSSIRSVLYVRCFISLSQVLLQLTMLPIVIERHPQRHQTNETSCLRRMPLPFPVQANKDQLDDGPGSDSQ